MKRKILFLAFMVPVFFWGFNEASAAGPTVVAPGEFFQPVTWTKEGSPYIIGHSINFYQKLTIEPGVVIKFKGAAYLYFSKGASIKGTNDKNIVFTSYKDDLIEGDTNNDGGDSVPAKNDGGGLWFNDRYAIEFEYVKLSYLTVAIRNVRYTDYYPYAPGSISFKNVTIANNKIGISIYNSAPVLENCIISDNYIGINIGNNFRFDNLAVVKNSLISNNDIGVSAFEYFQIYKDKLDARNNWWGSDGGPFYKHVFSGKDNLNEAGDLINGDGIIFDPWLGKDPNIKEQGCQENCYSNVMFLPGHQASRLYRRDSISEDQLWEPTNHNEDVQQLYLSPDDGSSNDPDIYTRDIMDEAYGIANIYKGFVASMDKFVADGFINKWQSFAYDWRKPLEEVVDSGTKLEDGSMSNVLDQIRESAKNSKTGKVTLIGHSNGGLLAKVIVDRLKQAGEEKLVDRVIMVATPQLGTPKAIASLLHGDGSNLALGLILDRKTARGFGENMASAYNLMPSKKYFDVVQDPVIEFDSDVKNIYDFPSIFGDNIDNIDEFKKFLLGDDGKRSEPDAGDTDSPNILKNNFFLQAEKTHDLLDSWQAPEGVEVVQIAGWGLDTIRGIKYGDCNFIFCSDKLSDLDRSPIFTQDGDETVIVPSAVEMDGNAERYYLNLNRYNRLANLKINREHADILEVESLQEFIKNIIQGNKNLTEYVYAEKPEVQDDDMRLRYRLHSPVALHIYDNEGRHTGPVENKDPQSDLRFYEKQVSNSYYMEFGEAKYAGAEGNIDQKVLLKGEDLGTFTFDIDEIVGNQESQTTTFSNIPVMQGMEAEVQISGSVGEMRIDVDHDGEMDAVLRPGEEIGKDDLLGIFEKIVKMLDIERSVKDRLINKIGNARKQIEKDHGASSDAMLANIEHQIEVFSSFNTPEKFRIPEDEAEKLIGIIEKIRAI